MVATDFSACFSPRFYLHESCGIRKNMLWECINKSSYVRFSTKYILHRTPPKRLY